MSNELRHKDVLTAGELTEAEHEGIATHVFNSQATGDILYASSATQLSRLAKGTRGLGGGITIAASDSLAGVKALADYVCDGTADDVEIQAACDALPAAGGKVILLEGNFTTIANITVPANATLEGQGKGATIITPTGAAITNGILLNGDNIVLRDMKVILAAGAGTAGARPNVIYSHTHDRYLLENLWLYGDLTVNDNNEARQNGVYSMASHYSTIKNCRVENCQRNGILVLNSWYVEVTDCLITATTFRGIKFENACRYGLISNNRLWDIPYDGIHIYNNTGQIVIDGNVLRNCGAGHDGNIVVHTGCYKIAITGNSIWQGGAGIQLYSDSIHCTVAGNAIDGCNQDGILIFVRANYNAFLGNTIQNCQTNGITVVESSYCAITGNVCTGTTGGDGINIEGDGGGNSDYNSVIGNVCTGNASDGIAIVGGANANKNIVLGNQLLGNTGLALNDAGTNTEYSVRHSDLFMDVLAVAAAHVRSNEDLSEAIPNTFTLTAQPDVPRTLSGHFDAHANITAYTIVITGVDAKGNTVSETFTEAASPWDFETSNAYATITSIIMTARTGTGAGDTMDIGITDVLGLSNKIYATSDVYKIKKNNANALVAVAQVNATYDTYDMSVITLGAADDFTIWYRSNLNIVS